MERAPHERDAFLAAACEDDLPLLDDARALLADAVATSLGDVTARLEAAVDRAAVEAVAGDGAHPARIGPYEIVRALGRGGMGVVYLGRQETPLRRDVAIKVVRGGIADRETLVRFAAERQAMARMEHPSIARVFDAGATDDGLPYFAMELVDGLPITEYCDRERLGLDARLALFRVVCHAVQHAHQRGVIHRDLKPSNILVVTSDGEPLPKVIDFGIAKAIEGMLAEESVHTRMGSLIGTLDYMSPEQIRGDDGAVDVRSDVYALGVVLYQLVSGRHPFDDTELRRAGVLDAQRIITETDPPRPSTSIGTAPDRAQRAHERATDERTLQRRLRADLDWVVMKALEKDRERRYQSALELAQDLERYARHEPVSAGPPDLTYRTRKFVRRHRVGASAALLIVLALLSGATLAATGFVRASGEARRAAAISTFLTDMLASVQPDQQGRAVTVREVLDDARGRLRGGELTGDVETEATLAFVIGHSYEGLGRFAEARELYEYAAVLRRRLHDKDDERLQGVLYRLATVLWKQGELEDALAMRLDLAATTARTLGPSHPDHAESLSNLGNTYADMGDLDRAVEHLRAAVAIGRTLEGEANELNLARFLNNLGSVHFDRRAYADALELFDEALAIRSRLLGEHSDVYAITLVNRGNAQLNLGRLEDAERTLRRAVQLEEEIFGEAHPTTASAYSALSEVLHRQGRHLEAEPYVRRTLDIRIATAGAAYWRIAAARRNLAEVLIATDRLTEAETELQTAWDGLVAADELSRPAARDVAAAMAGLQALLADSARAADWAALADES